MSSNAHSQGDVMSTNKDLQEFEDAIEAANHDPYDGLTTKEIARLKAVAGENIGIDKEWADMNLREKIYTTFEDPTANSLAVIISVVINTMIILSTITFITETMPETADVPASFWSTVETVCIVGFTTDFVAKASTTPEFHLFAKDPMNAIDFIAILPFYIELVWALFSDKESGLSNLRLIRVVRLARILRIFKQTKSGNMTSVIGIIISSSVAALAIPLYFLFLAVVVYASLMYYAERGTPVTCYGPGLSGDPDLGWTYHYGPDSSAYCNEDAEQKLKAMPQYKNASYACDPYDGTHVHSHITKGATTTNAVGMAGQTRAHHGTDCCYCLPDGQYVGGNKFESIPDGLWWCVVTFTTVGYGDKFPVTWIGRGVAILTMVTGVFFMAMPLTIIGTAFNAAWEGIQEDQMRQDIMDNRGSTPKSEVLLLAKFYEFAESCVTLESAVVSKTQQERLGLRKEIGDLMQPLRQKHAAFRKCLTKTLEIYPIPEDLDLAAETAIGQE
eukprot:COSAG01_NODE_483_length_16412_cov_17.605162_9_plen_502_part_00